MRAQPYSCSAQRWEAEASVRTQHGLHRELQASQGFIRRLSQKLMNQKQVIRSKHLFFQYLRIWTSIWEHLLNLLLFICMSSLCGYAHICDGACGSQRHQVPLELELQACWCKEPNLGPLQEPYALSTENHLSSPQTFWTRTGNRTRVIAKLTYRS